MSDWIDVPVAEVAVGDRATVDGYGQFKDGNAVQLFGGEFKVVGTSAESYVNVELPSGTAIFRRSSIVAVRRRKPELSTKPKPLTCHDGVTYKTADGSDACLACSLILNKRSDVHTPKDPVRGPGCCAAHPEGGFGCTDHEGGFHIAKDLYGTVVCRWPEQPSVACPWCGGYITTAPTKKPKAKKGTR